MAVANETTEADITGFLRTVMASEAFDYAVDSVATFPAASQGWVEQGGELVLAEPVEESRRRGRRRSTAARSSCNAAAARSSRWRS